MLHHVPCSTFRVQKLTPSSSGEGLLFRFPEPNTIHDVDWIGVLSRRKKVSYVASCPPVLGSSNFTSRGCVSLATACLKLVVQFSGSLSVRNWIFRVNLFCIKQMIGNFTQIS